MGGENPPIMQPKWASLAWHFQDSHSKHCIFKSKYPLENLGPKKRAQLESFYPLFHPKVKRETSAIFQVVPLNKLGF